MQTRADRPVPHSASQSVVGCTKSNSLRQLKEPDNKLLHGID
jgi:hypothetical protein